MKLSQKCFEGDSSFSENHYVEVLARDMTYGNRHLRPYCCWLPDSYFSEVPKLFPSTGLRVLWVSEMGLWSVQMLFR